MKECKKIYNVCQMKEDIKDIIEENIFKFMVKNEIKPREINVILTDIGYHAEKTKDSKLSKFKLNGTNKFLKKQNEIDTILTSIMKKKYGTWQETERQIGVTSFHAKVLRWIDNSNELLKHFDCKLHINNYENNNK